MQSSDISTAGGYTINGSNYTPTWSRKRKLFVFNAGTTVGDHKSPYSFGYQREWQQSQKDSATWPDAGSPGGMKRYEGNFGYPVSQSVAAWHNSELTDSYNNALSKLNESIRGDTDISIDAFQARQTAHTWKDVKGISGNVSRLFAEAVGPRTPFKGVYGTAFRRTAYAAYCAKQGMPFGDILIGTMKQFGSAWSLWTYGIRPVISDIHAVATYNREQISREPFVLRGQHRNKVLKTIPIAGWPDYTYSSTMEIKCSYRTRIQIWMDCNWDDPELAVGRLASLDPKQWIWEALPWSFVVDWFLNVGNYLRDLETASMYNRYMKYGMETTTSLSTFF